MFFDLCRVDVSVGTSEWVKVLAPQTPPPGGELFVMEGNKPVWCPAWGEKIDQDVNTKFVNEVICCVWDAEMVSEVSLHGYG